MVDRSVISCGDVHTSGQGPTAFPEALLLADGVTGVREVSWSSSAEIHGLEIVVLIFL
jgi:hypothetical protein